MHRRMITSCAGSLMRDEIDLRLIVFD